MHYLFIFLLISCVSVGILTYILTFALFFRHKTALEKYFIAFLTCFTLRMIIDVFMFYMLPLLPATSTLLFISLLAGRLTVFSSIVFLSLFMHKLTGLFQSKGSRLMVSLISLGVVLFFAIQYIIAHLDQAPTMDDLYAFSPVDFSIYILMLYPFGVFIVFSRRIKNNTLYKLIRNFIIMMIFALPFIFFEDIFGTITVIFDAARQNPLPLKLFPVYYLLLYCFLLVNGFRSVIAEKKLSREPHAISDEFINRYGITAREKEIILLLIEGHSNKAIAQKLFISTATARNHLHNIFEKTRATNRVELLRLATS